MDTRRNLEVEMSNAQWFVDKVCASPIYAQHVYAGLCNNEFLPLEVFSILKHDTWACTWRMAGGIVADLRQEGDYLDWYCSGINDTSSKDNKSIQEGTITEEFAKDLEVLGWKVV